MSEIEAHKALKIWCESDEGKAAIAKVGGVLQSNPIYLAFMAGWKAANPPYVSAEAIHLNEAGVAASAPACNASSGTSRWTMMPVVSTSDR